MKLKTLIPYILGLILIFIIGYFVGYNSIIDALKEFKWYYLPLVLILELIEYYLQVLRANNLFKATNHDVSKGLISNYAIGHAVSFIIPTRALGELARYFTFSKLFKIKLNKVIAAMSVERIFDVLFLALTVVITSFLFASKVKFASLIGGLFAFGVLLLILIIVSKFFKKALIWIFNKLRLNKLGEFISGYIDSSKEIFTNKKTLIISSFYTIVLWIVDYLRVWLIFGLFGYWINPLIIFGIVALSYLLAIIFILPGGLGIFEGGSTLVLTQFNVPSNIAFTGIFIERLFSYWLWVFLGLFFLSKKATNINLKEVFKRDKND